jgi:D-glycero-alpha-D-manno-heptose-7-phosphate kinase
MIIRSKAPLRLGLAGGGSDVSPYSDIYGGLILNATINLYAYCTIEETDDNQITINAFDAHCNKSYSMVESLEIDGEAILIKGVYNRVVKDFGVGAKSFKITTYNDCSTTTTLTCKVKKHTCLQLIDNPSFNLQRIYDYDIVLQELHIVKTTEGCGILILLTT